MKKVPLRPREFFYPNLNLEFLEIGGPLLLKQGLR